MKRVVWILSAAAYFASAYFSPSLAEDVEFRGCQYIKVTERRDSFGAKATLSLRDSQVVIVAADPHSWFTDDIFIRLSMVKAFVCFSETEHYRTMIFVKGEKEPILYLVIIYDDKGKLGLIGLEMGRNEQESLIKAIEGKTGIKVLNKSPDEYLSMVTKWQKYKMKVSRL